MAVSHFSPQFQISARAETHHVITTKFQPGGRAEISARAETRHVIDPLVKRNEGQLQTNQKQIEILDHISVSDYGNLLNIRLIV